MPADQAVIRGLPDSRKFCNIPAVSNCMFSYYFPVSFHAILEIGTGILVVLIESV